MLKFSLCATCTIMTVMTFPLYTYYLSRMSRPSILHTSVCTKAPELQMDFAENFAVNWVQTTVLCYNLIAY